MGKEITEGIDQRTVDGPGPLGTAESEDYPFTFGDSETQIAQCFFPSLGRNGMPYRISHNDAIFREKGEGLRKGQEHPVDPPSQHGIELAGNAVLFVQVHPGWSQSERSQDKSGDNDRGADVASRGNHPLRCKPEEDEKRLENSKAEPAEKTQRAK